MADYILEPLDTDAEVIYQGFIEFMQTYYPDWQPSEGQLDVIIGRYFSMQTAFTADMASRVLRAIYRYFGSSLAGIPPLPGSAAIATIHFDISDPLHPPVDRVMAFGTLVGLTDRDGDVQMFALLDDMIVPAGTETAEVDAQAIELGSIANGISGTVELIEMADWVGAAHVVGVSAGGSNPEDDEVYIQRLTENFALMAPRPLLAEDFAVMAKNIPGVWRAAALDNFNPGTLEKQTLTGTATSGTVTLNFYGVVTNPVTVLATQDQIRDALAALSNLDITDITVAGGPLGTAPITIEFKGRYGYMNVDPITVNNASAVGGTVTVATTVAGTPYTLDAPNSIAISAVDENGNPLADDTKQDLVQYLESHRAQNFAVIFVDPAYHTVDINYVAKALRNQSADSVMTVAELAFTNYLDRARWGIYPYETNSRTWVLSPTVRYLELTTVLENTQGVDYTESLTFSLDGSSFTAADKDFTGAFSLTQPGAFNGTIHLPT